MLGGFITVVISFFMIYHQLYRFTDDFVIDDINQVAILMNLEVSQVARYQDDDTFYYVVDYQKESNHIKEISSLIYIYHLDTQISYYFDISDSESYQDDLTKVKYLEEHSKRTIIDPSPFND